MRRHGYPVAFSLLVASYMPFCTPAVRPTVWPDAPPLTSLWEPPTDLPHADLFGGAWGRENAPDPNALYRIVEEKHHGINPGYTVRDPEGHKWSVKLAPIDGEPSEAPVEVVLSRVLSAVGYHQPPVYYLASFKVADDWGTRTEGGARFRLHHKKLKDKGEWSWQQNPYVGTQPYQGLLVILLLFNSSDLKNENNTLYQYRTGDFVQSWYVVRDIGTSLGDTGRLAPRRNDPAVFAREPFILGVRDGFVEFNYRGWHQELVRNRITPADVRWAGRLLSGLSPRQWADAFRAGGYAPAEANQFIRALAARIAQANSFDADD